MSLAEPPLPDRGAQTEYRRARSRFAALRTIGALMLREMTTQYGRKPGGYIWAIVQPLATIMVLAFAFSLLARTPALGTSFFLFKATGLMVFQLFRTTMQMVGGAISYTRPLLAYPGVTWIDAILARFLLNGLVQTLVLILILAGDVLIEDLWLIPDWRMILLSVGMALALGFGMGVLHCFLLEWFEIWGNIWRVVSAPLLIVSGVILLYEDMPELARDVLWYNPLIHVVGMMRAGFYSTYQPQYLSFMLPALCTLVPLALGLLLVRRHHRTLIRN